MILSVSLVASLMYVPPKIVDRPFPRGRLRDTTVTYIVIHNDSSPTPRVTFKYLKRHRNSYHYYISRDGTIHRLVDPRYEASHAGLTLYDGYVRMNRYSIGICFENMPPQEYTDAQYKSGAWLVQQLHKRFPDSKTKPVVGHEDIAIPRGRKNDPGQHFNWQTFNEYITRNDSRGRSERLFRPYGRTSKVLGNRKSTAGKRQPARAVRRSDAQRSGYN